MTRVVLVFFCGAFFFLGCQGWHSSPPTDFAYKVSSASQGPDLNATIDFLEKRIAKKPKAFLEQAELASLYLQRSRSQRSEKDLELAQQWLEKSLKTFENSPALLVKAEILQMEHHFSEALLVLEQALQLEPGSVPAQVLAVRIALAQGDLTQAKERLAQIPEVPLASLSFLRGQVQEASGQIDLARASYSKAIQGEADSGSANESARWRGVWARMELEQGDLEKAKELLQAAQAIATEQPLTYQLRIQVLVKEKSYQQALELCQQAYELYQDPSFLLRMGEVQQASGDSHGAQQSWQAAAKLLKQDSFGHERDLALVLHYLDPQKNATEIADLMKKELNRRRDPETLRIEALVKVGSTPSPQ